jgi:hypothetical protein
MGRRRPTGLSPPNVDGRLGDEAVTAVLVGDRAGGVPALDEVSIRQIIGLVHADMQPEAVPEGRMLTAASPRHG